MKYYIYTSDNNIISWHSREFDENTSINDVKELYKAPNVAVGDTLTDTSDMTISDGQLVPASAEVIAERLHLKQLAEHETIRAERQRRYESEEITSLYWDWQESGLESDKQLWIAAKEAVREELPYPEDKGGEK